MSIFVKSEQEISGIAGAARIVGATLAVLRDEVTPGMTTQSLADRAEALIAARGGRAAFRGYRGFPAAICVSVNDEVVHGLPGDRVLAAGDLVKIDVGVEKGGFFADGAVTVKLAVTDADRRRLVEATAAALKRGIAAARPGNHVSDISHAIGSYVAAQGFSVVEELAGHGVGLTLHEEPSIPNFGPAGHGPRLRDGMTLAIEPMVNLGGAAVRTLADGWTVVTADGAPSAHFEHTILVAATPRVLTETNG